MMENMVQKKQTSSKVISWSVKVGIVGTLPLLIYIMIGPKDGNPIGLGLLAVVAMLVAVTGVVIGLITKLAHRLRSRQ